MSENNSPGHSVEQPIQWPVYRTNYVINTCIGHGATSEVFQAICTPLNKPCAIKIINLEKNENIVTYYASFVDNIELLIVMDLCQRGSLLDMIKHTQKKRDITYGVFDEAIIATILRDVLKGLAYIHDNGLVHRDLKCGNLLLKDDGVIQIADFGVAGFLATQHSFSNQEDTKRFTFVGTPCWMAPEVMQQSKGYDQRADIWSLGISTIEMATGQAPYAKFVPMKVLMLTLKNPPPDIDTLATLNNQYVSYGAKYRKFCRACLMKDPLQRTPAKELLNHIYIKSKAKERDFLMKTLLSEDIPKPTRQPKNSEQTYKEGQNDPSDSATGWIFSSDDDSDNEAEQKTSNSQARKNMKLFQENNNLPLDSAETLRIHAPTPKPTPSTPNEKPITNSDSSTLENVKSANISQKQVVSAFRITLRKRNLKQNNELQDISFSFVINKDQPDLLARELVEEGLLDGCDLLLVAHHMRELIENPSKKSVVFPLNSPPAPGLIPTEEELHGYAKVLIRNLTPDQVVPNLPTVL